MACTFDVVHSTIDSYFGNSLLLFVGNALVVVGGVVVH